MPASAADAIWPARDLAALMDEIETEGSDWTKLAAHPHPSNLCGLVAGDAGLPADRDLDWFEALRAPTVDPAAHRNALIRMKQPGLARAPRSAR